MNVKLFYSWILTYHKVVRQHIWNWRNTYRFNSSFLRRRLHVCTYVVRTYIGLHTSVLFQPTWSMWWIKKKKDNKDAHKRYKPQKHLKWKRTKTHHCRCRLFCSNKRKHCSTNWNTMSRMYKANTVARIQKTVTECIFDNTFKLVKLFILFLLCCLLSCCRLCWWIKMIKNSENITSSAATGSRTRDLIATLLSHTTQTVAFHHPLIFCLRCVVWLMMWSISLARH